MLEKITNFGQNGIRVEDTFKKNNPKEDILNLYEIKDKEITALTTSYMRSIAFLHGDEKLNFEDGSLEYRDFLYRSNLLYETMATDLKDTNNNIILDKLREKNDELTISFFNFYNACYDHHSGKNNNVFPLLVDLEDKFITLVADYMSYKYERTITIEFDGIYEPSNFNNIGNLFDKQKYLDYIKDMESNMKNIFGTNIDIEEEKIIKKGESIVSYPVTIKRVYESPMNNNITQTDYFKGHLNLSTGIVKVEEKVDNTEERFFMISSNGEDELIVEATNKQEALKNANIPQEDWKKYVVEDSAEAPRDEVLFVKSEAIVMDDKEFKITSDSDNEDIQTYISLLNEYKEDGVIDIQVAKDIKEVNAYIAEKMRREVDMQEVAKEQETIRDDITLSY